MKESLSDIGEKEIINRIKMYMPKGQVNDDTAEILTESKKLLINNDLLVDGVHFSDKTSSSEDVGWKAVTSNLSDLASSGVDKIIGITVGLVAPPDTSWLWVKGVYEGINQALEKFGGTLLGGDCSKGSQKILSITALGTLGKLRLHQANALPNDQIIVSGAHGLSRLGLALLLSDPVTAKNDMPEALRRKAIRIHQRPNPPLEALKTLQNCKPKDLPWRAAATDSSDGLLEAVNNLCIHSKCQAVLSESSIPRSKFWPKGFPWDEWCMNGGEDFELVISLPPAWAKEMLAALPSSYVIGYMQEGEAKITWKDKKSQFNQRSNCFQHF